MTGFHGTTHETRPHVYNNSDNCQGKKLSAVAAAAMALDDETTSTWKVSGLTTNSTVIDDDTTDKNATTSSDASSDKRKSSMSSSTAGNRCSSLLLREDNETDMTNESGSEQFSIVQMMSQHLEGFEKSYNSSYNVTSNASKNTNANTSSETFAMNISNERRRIHNFDDVATATAATLIDEEKSEIPSTQNNAKSSHVSNDWRSRLKYQQEKTNKKSVHDKKNVRTSPSSQTSWTKMSAAVSSVASGNAVPPSTKSCLRYDKSIPSAVSAAISLSSPKWARQRSSPVPIRERRATIFNPVGVTDPDPRQGLSVSSCYNRDTLLPSEAIESEFSNGTVDNTEDLIELSGHLRSGKSLFKRTSGDIHFPSNTHNQPVDFVDVDSRYCSNSESISSELSALVSHSVATSYSSDGVLSYSDSGSAVLAASANFDNVQQFDVQTLSPQISSLQSNSSVGLIVDVNIPTTCNSRSFVQSASFEADTILGNNSNVCDGGRMNEKNNSGIETNDSYDSVSSLSSLLSWSCNDVDNVSSMPISCVIAAENTSTMKGSKNATSPLSSSLLDIDNCPLAASNVFISPRSTTGSCRTEVNLPGVSLSAPESTKSHQPSVEYIQDGIIEGPLTDGTDGLGKVWRRRLDILKQREWSSTSTEASIGPHLNSRTIQNVVAAMRLYSYDGKICKTSRTTKKTHGPSAPSASLISPLSAITAAASSVFSLDCNNDCEDNMPRVRCMAPGMINRLPAKLPGSCYSNDEKIELPATKVLFNRQLMSHVFSTLDVLSRCCAAQVCRAWREVLWHCELWRVVDLSFVSRNVTDDVISSLMRRSFGQLTHLVLTDCWSLTDAGLCTAISNEMDSISCLEVLVLSGCWALSSRPLILFGDFQLPRLRILEIVCLRRVTDQGLLSIVAAAPSLEHIDLSYCKSITNAGVMQLSLSKIRLRSLSLHRCTALNDHAFDFLQTTPRSSLSTLRELRLSDLEFLTDSQLLLVLHQCAMLSSLSVAFCTQLSPLSLGAISKLALASSLRDFDMSGCSAMVTDCGIAALCGVSDDLKDDCGGVFGLRTIGLRFCSQLTAVGIDTLLRTNCELRDLKVSPYGNIPFEYRSRCCLIDKGNATLPPPMRKKHEIGRLMFGPAELLSKKTT